MMAIKIVVGLMAASSAVKSIKPLADSEICLTYKHESTAIGL